MIRGIGTPLRELQLELVEGVLLLGG